MKKIIFMSIVFIFLFSNTAFGKDYTDIAKQLESIGVFKGTENGFELDRAPTRVEGLIMFIRLIGKESEALGQDWSHPFNDVPTWADKYVGWAYQKGYTKGISQTEFGSGNIDSKSYMTFLLRALGYDDSKGDFKWEQSLEKGKEIGIIEPSKLDDLEGKTFLRGNLAYLSFNTLNVNLKDSNITLKEKINVNLTDDNIHKDEKTEGTINNESKMGNTYGNLANMGKIIKKGDYLYFRNSQNGLIKYNTITNEKETIYNDGVVNNMNIIDDAIYFRNEVGIYRINLSTNQTKLIHAFNYGKVKPQGGTMFIIGDDIYFKGTTFGIEKMKLDGTNHKVLYASEIFDFFVYENKIYFHDKGKGGFYTINIDGTNLKLFSDVELWYYLDGCVNDGWIYFHAKSPNPEYYGALYRIKPDGNDIECLIENMSWFNIADDKIFYVSFDQKFYPESDSVSIGYSEYKFYSSDLDGTNNTKLIEGTGNINYLNIVDDNGIFYDLWNDVNIDIDSEEDSGFYYLDLKTLEKIIYIKY